MIKRSRQSPKRKRHFLSRLVSPRISLNDRYDILFSRCLSYPWFHSSRKMSSPLLVVEPPFRGRRLRQDDRPLAQWCGSPGCSTACCPPAAPSAPARAPRASPQPRPVHFYWADCPDPARAALRCWATADTWGLRDCGVGGVDHQRAAAGLPPAGAGAGSIEYGGLSMGDISHRHRQRCSPAADAGVSRDLPDDGLSLDSSGVSGWCPGHATDPVWCGQFHHAGLLLCCRARAGGNV